ncbi:MAG: (Fe-S)-binding protein [Candidatus Hermodarchaeota archaeon]
MTIDHFPEEDYQKMIKRCLRCSVCKWIPQVQIKSQKYASACPAIDIYNFHPYSGGGKIILALAYEMGRIQPTEELRDIVYKCTECGNCAVGCKYMNTLEPLEIMMRLREKLVDEGCGPMPQQQIYTESIKKLHNPYNEPHEKRMDWIPDDIKLNPNAKTLYFVGCTSSYRRKEMAIAAAQIMNKANVPFNILHGDEFCCGSPILRVGDKTTFEELLNRNLDIIESKGIETVVFSCAGCYDTFKVDYPLCRKYKFNVKHIVELYDDLIKSGDLKLSENVPITVTYHDPCHLGRNAERYEYWDGDIVPLMPLVSINVPPKPKRTGSKGVYDAPRNIIKRIPGLKLVEMERIQEYAYCCGAGAGVKSAFPEMAIKTAKIRIEEAEDTRADAIVSTCPFCSTNLQDGIAEKKSKLKYFDISELILMALGLEPEKLKRAITEAV